MVTVMVVIKVMMVVVMKVMVIMMIKEMVMVSGGGGVVMFRIIAICDELVSRSFVLGLYLCIACMCLNSTGTLFPISSLHSPPGCQELHRRRY